MKLPDILGLLSRTDACETQELVAMARVVVADVAQLTSDGRVTLTDLIAMWDTRDIMTLLIAKKVLEDDSLRRGRSGMYVGNMDGRPPAFMPEISDGLA